MRAEKLPVALASPPAASPVVSSEGRYSAPVEIEWDLTSIVAEVHRRMRPRTPLPEIAARFRRFTGMAHRTRLRDGCLEVHLSDLLQEAPPSIINAAVTILLARLYKFHAPGASLTRYKRYVESLPVQAAIQKAAKDRGRKVVAPPQGLHHDLREVFSKVNGKFFGGGLPVPVLGWSRIFSRVRLGHYDSSHNAIVISRLLDTLSVPVFVLDFVMYHEMLHIKHRVEVRGGRRVIHSAAFRAEEKLFPRYREVKDALKKLHWRAD